MITGPSAGTPVDPRQPAMARGAAVVELAPWRIERALARRERYRYVRPRLERDGRGWRVVSPNCSRNIDPAGGDIDIAWLVPVNGGLWLLHARDHQQGCWRLEGAGLTLDEALARLCEDERRVYWP